MGVGLPRSTSPASRPTSSAAPRGSRQQSKPLSRPDGMRSSTRSGILELPAGCDGVTTLHENFAGSTVWRSSAHHVGGASRANGLNNVAGRSDGIIRNALKDLLAQVLVRGRCVSRRDDGSVEWSVARPLGSRSLIRIPRAPHTYGVPRSIGTGRELAASCATLLARVELCPADLPCGRLTAGVLAPSAEKEQQA